MDSVCIALAQSSFSLKNLQLSACPLCLWQRSLGGPSSLPHSPSWPLQTSAQAWYVPSQLEIWNVIGSMKQIDPCQPQGRTDRFHSSWFLRRVFQIFSSQVLLRQQPGTSSTTNNTSSYASVTELGVTESEHGLEHHKMMIVEADLGPADPGPVLLPEPTNTEHMIRWKR